MHAEEVGFLEAAIDLVYQSLQLLSGALSRGPEFIFVPIVCTVDVEQDFSIDTLELAIGDAFDNIKVASAIMLSATERLYCTNILLEGKQLLVSVGRLLLSLRQRFPYVQTCTAQLPKYGALSTEPFLSEGEASFLSPEHCYVVHTEPDVQLCL